jgi:hypothetical protein
MSTPPVRTDHEPLTKRFPQLGNFIATHWQGESAGTDTGGVPGPTDVRIRALVQLSANDRSALGSRYSWSPAPADWDKDMSSELRVYLPSGSTWKANDRFTSDLLSGGYSGPVYLDTRTGIVYLDVIGR